MTDRTAGTALVAAGVAAVFAAVSVAAAIRACRCPVPGTEGAPGAKRPHRGGHGTIHTHGCSPPDC
ncbi:hypothetical protein [Kitasatospora brasiliensis]|uniref:hypothetical protein n=1 Tax=Kitasatospora brasiliensis TaxID=3058040 RepID=UPI00293063FE|nr:hypothetical protein [Kitasatospora sp. K002]